MTGRMSPCAPCWPPSPIASPTGDAWVHEVKWDGMRVLVDVRDGVVTIWSRNERDVTAAYPELEELGRDYDDMLLDGEVVALDGGRPSFHALTERMHVARPAPRPAPGRDPAGDPHGLRPPAAVRLRPHGPAVVGEEGAARAARPQRPALAGARGLRRRPPAARRHQRAGPRGHRQQAPLRALRRRPALDRLAQDRAPRQPVGRGRRLATGGGLERAARGRARRPARRRRGLAVRRPRGLRPGRHRRRGARPAAAPARAAPTSPFVDEVPAIDAQRHHLGRARVSSSRCAPSSSPASTGCASRPTSGCAPT